MKQRLAEVAVAVAILGAVFTLGMVIGSGLEANNRPTSPAYRYQLILSDKSGRKIVCPVATADIEYMRLTGRLDITNMQFRGLE